MTDGILEDAIRLLATPWGLIFVFLLLIFISNAPLLIVSWLMAPRDTDPVRDAPFESGQIPIGEARRRFVMQYYPYLLIFVVLDVLAMFLFAWGLATRSLGIEANVLMILFLLILMLPISYALRMAERRELW